MSDLTLQNETLSLTFSGETGALTGLASALTGWRVLDRPELGLSFRLLVPLSEERRNNQVLGERQRPAAIEPGRDGRSLRIAWKGVVSELGAELDIGLELTVRLEERRAVFALFVENRSPCTVENVYCPYLGDVRPPAGAEWLKTFLYHYGSAQEWGLWPTYQNLRGYYGSDYPVQFSPVSAASATPMVPFMLVRSPQEGLYLGGAEDTTELVAWHTELRPGYSDSIDCRVPEPGSIPGAVTSIRVAAVALPYIRPGERRQVPPMALECYRGDWQAGAELYRTELRRRGFSPARPPAWVREPHAWQQVHMNSPEDELRLRYLELPRIGEECARHGVRALQLVGWNDGGQDQGNPSHDVDPRLGTFEELRRAIAEIQAMGVKVVLFAKFTWADRATPSFRERLHRHAVRDPYGDYYVYAGYQYQTATQFLDVNTKRLVPMCFLDEDYLRLCEAEFRKILDLGAAGFLFDECLHHTPALLCFDERHGHRAGAPVYANDNLLIERFTPMAAAYNPEFLFAGEACYDREMAVYQLSYHRSENKQHVPLPRFVLPGAQYMTAVTGFDDRSMVNQSLLYRYVVSYEPFNFKGRLADFPLTLAYGKRMDALRTELREWFWDGEFRGGLGARVTTEGRPHHPYAVYLGARSRTPGLVVVNYEPSAVALDLALDGAGPLRWRTIDDPAWRPLAGALPLPPRSAAVVLPA